MFVHPHGSDVLQVTCGIRVIRQGQLSSVSLGLMVKVHCGLSVDPEPGDGSEE